MQNSSLRKYRSQKNLEQVQASEEDAKLILREMVIHELSYVGKKMIENIETLNLKPKYTNALMYFVEKYTQGGIGLDLHSELTETVTGVPTEEGEGGYTTGGEFSVLSTGESYSGYYHVHVDEDGETVYMEGETHTEEEHEVIIPLMSSTELAFGDFESYGSPVSSDTTKPFRIEKFMAINGTKMAPSAAISTVTSVADAPILNISEVYPGDMSLIYPPVEPDSVVTTPVAPIGVVGSLGVTYGLEFSIVVGGKKHVLTEVEMSALDTKCSLIPPLSGNSKLLYCLLKQLLDDERFKLITDYIVPIRNTIAMGAIYNDMGFLPSIGEVTVEDGDSYSTFWKPKESDFDSKPGAKVSNRTISIGPDGTIETSYDYVNKPGWTSFKDRQPGWWASLVWNHWDKWDKELLRNSRTRIKKVFRKAYNDRDFDLSGGTSDGDGPAAVAIKNAMSSLMPGPGALLLPWWKKGKLRPSPFDKNGNECSPTGRD
jgi:hypothetical protein